MRLYRLLFVIFICCVLSGEEVTSFQFQAVSFSHYTTSWSSNNASVPTTNVISSRNRRRMVKAVKAGKNLELQENDDEQNESNIQQLYITALVPLLLIYISNQWSRNAIYYLVDFKDSTDMATMATMAMNVDLDFDKGQYGALASVAFTTLFAVASLFGGSFADRYDRKLLTVGSCIVWAGASLATALAHNYNEVLVARIIMGLACAFTTPAAYTLIRDLFPKSKAAFASSTYGAGIYLGGALASLTVLLDTNFGWRSSYETVATYGLATCIVGFLLLPQDPNFSMKNKIKNESAVFQEKVAEEDSKNRSSIVQDVLDVVETDRIRWLFFATLVRFCSGLCIGIWNAPYIRLAFPESTDLFSIDNAVIVGACGATSGIVGGFIADKLGEMASANDKDPNEGRLLLPIISSLLAAPAFWFCSHSDTFQLAMIWLAIEYLVAECWFGPTISVLQSTVGQARGGIAQGMFTLTGAIGNVAPALLGAVYGQASSTIGVDEATNNGLLLADYLGVTVSGCYLLSAIGFYMCLKSSSKSSSV